MNRPYHGSEIAHRVFGLLKHLPSSIEIFHSEDTSTVHAVSSTTKQCRDGSQLTLEMTESSRDPWSTPSILSRSFANALPCRRRGKTPHNVKSFEDFECLYEYDAHHGGQKADSSINLARMAILFPLP